MQKEFNNLTANEKVLVNLSTAILEGASASAQPLIRDLDKSNNEDLKKNTYIIFECLYFYIHFADRTAFALLGHEKRELLMDEFEPLAKMTYIDLFFPNWPEKYVNPLEVDFIKNINLAQEEYSQYKLLPEKQGDGWAPPKDSLLWEFSKNVTELSKHPHNPEIILQVMEATVLAIKKLQLDEIIKSFNFI